MQQELLTKRFVSPWMVNLELVRTGRQEAKGEATLDIGLRLHRVRLVQHKNNSTVESLLGAGIYHVTAKGRG